MISRWASVFGLALALSASASCGQQVDLAKLTPTDVLTGWYDDGVVSGGLNHLIPSISLRLKNTDTVAASEVDLTISFWPEGADGEIDSAEVAGVGREPLAPGASTNPILVRVPTGYTLEQPRAELFTHSKFKDFTAKIFAKRSGKIVPIGQFKIDRRILPHMTANAGRP